MNDFDNGTIRGYEKEEKYNSEVTLKLMEHYKAILSLLGDDVER